jgi:hypothetical protein
LLGQNRIDGSTDNFKISADHSNVSGSSTIEFLVDGSEKMRINNSGNVGIGETSIDAKLHLTASSAGLINQKFESAGSAAWRIASQTYFAFDNANDNLSAPKVVIDSSGRLGIGTTSPTAKLHIIGNSSFPQVRINDDTGGGESGIRFRSNNGINGLHSDIFVQRTGNETGRMGFRVPYNQERLTILHTGDVGIGTNSPATKLHVVQTSDDSGITISSSSFRPEISFVDDATGDNFKIGHNRSTSDLYIEINNTPTHAFSDDGKFGIGTTSPSEKLDVAGKVQADNAFIVQGIDTSNSQPSTDNAFLSGYGLIGNRSTFYITNGGGAVQIGRGTTHNASPTATFASNGNVGIGTTSPSGKLNIQQSSLNTAALFIGRYNAEDSPIIQIGESTSFSGTSAYGEALIASRNRDIVFSTGDFQSLSSVNTAALIIEKGEGNVGIGLTSPSYKLDVSGNLRTTSTIDAGGSITASSSGFVQLKADQTDSAAIRMGVSSGSSEGFIMTDTTGTFHSSNSPVLKFLYNDGTTTEYARFTTTGLGIGTTSPSAKLDVNGAIVSRGGTYNAGTDTNSNVGLAIQEGDYIYTQDGSYLRRLIGKGTDDYIEIGATGTSLIDGIRFKSGSSCQYLWYNSSSEVMRLNATGLGIGTSSPTTKLTVHKSIGLGDSIVDLKDTSTTLGGAYIEFQNSTGGVAGRINHNGTSTVQYNTSSDYRLKENVVPMTGALDRVNALNPCRFNFIGETPTVDGFLAHEVQDIVPEAIDGVKDGVDSEGNPRYQGIDQSKLVPLLVGAIQELKAEIEQLKAQINS